MAGLGVTFWAEMTDLDRLFRVERLCYLVGGYDGSSNYGDVLQLVTTLRRARAACPEMLAVALLHHPVKADHEELLRRHPELFGDFCPLYYSLPEDRVHPEVTGQEGQRLRRLMDAPPCYAQVTVYGGGYFNSRWGGKKLDLLEALEQWLAAGSPAGARPPAVIVVGQQVSPDFLESSEGARLGSFLERTDAFGLRDEDSLRVLGAKYGPHIAEKLFLSGDDAVTVLLKKGSRIPTGRQPNREDGRPFTVNVHLNLEDYVTGNPARHLEVTLTLLRQMDRLRPGQLVVNLITAFEDSRISESRYLERVRSELGWLESRFRSVNCLDDWAEGFPVLRAGDLTISSSYHVALTSLTLAVPTVLLQSNAYYRQKAHGLQETFQIPDCLLLEVGATRDDGLAALSARLVEDADFRTSLQRAAAEGTAIIALRSADTTAALARFWSVGYQAHLTGKYQICTKKLAQSMEQLSDLQFDYERLLNATKRVQRQGGSKKAGDYLAFVARVRRVADTVIPTGAKVLVISRGGEELLKLGEREGWHFPQTKDGIYAGHHPADSEAAIAHLEELRERGADFLLLPSTAFWWLDHYVDFRKHLGTNYFEVVGQEDACVVFALNASAKTRAAERRLRWLEAELVRFKAAVSLSKSGSEQGGYEGTANPRLIDSNS